MFESIKNIDISVINYIYEHLKNPVLDILMPIITWLGNVGAIWIVISIILIISKKYRTVGIIALFSLLLSAVLGEGLLKPLIQRPRPFLEVMNIDSLISKPKTYSFPSGHTSSSFAIVGVVIAMVKDKRITIPLIILACLIAFSRVYLGVHYFSDIIGGSILGIVSSIISCKIISFLSKNTSKEI